MPIGLSIRCRKKYQFCRKYCDKYADIEEFGPGDRNQCAARLHLQGPLGPRPEAGALGSAFKPRCEFITRCALAGQGREGSIRASALGRLSGHIAMFGWVAFVPLLFGENSSPVTCIIA